MRRQIVLSLASVSAVILIDQVSKHWVTPQLNAGIAFGTQVPSGLLSLLVLVLLLSLLSLLWKAIKQDNSLLVLSLSLILGGGVSNVIDRVLQGGVRDWLPIPFMNLQNNVADWAVVIGSIGVLATLLLAKKMTPES